MTSFESHAPTTPPASSATAQSRTQDGEVATRATEPLRDDAAFEISPRAIRAAYSGGHERQPGEPLYRPLRIYTLDPTISRRDGSVTTVNVPFEPLDVGPTSSLLEIIDEGAGNGEPKPEPLDLDDKFLLLEQGVTPSPADPRFRAQMTYAVCSTTYAAFRQALGRDLTWGFMRGSTAEQRTRLKVRANYSDERNAYYDSISGELRFGAFVAPVESEVSVAPLALIY
ncbi:MAG TPA: hypothetical protein VM053_11360, partial [Gemmatimonadaceae bacterium]|nr:hypothetical protein [Gemmatimonadaceae bacterium]